MSREAAFTKPGQRFAHEGFTDLRQKLGNDDAIIVRPRGF